MSYRPGQMPTVRQPQIIIGREINSLAQSLQPSQGITLLPFPEAGLHPCGQTVHFRVHYELLSDGAVSNETESDETESDKTGRLPF